MTDKDIKDELVQDLEVTDEEAESVKGGMFFSAKSAKAEKTKKTKKLISRL